MADLIQQYENPRFAFEKERVDRTAAQFDTDASVGDGVVRWNSNAQVPPVDILELWRHLGKPFDFDKSVAAREVDLDRQIADYRRRMANHVPSDEEMFEMRAAFGPGSTVVNVLTGEKTYL